MFTKNELELTYNGDRLDEMLQILDDLHTAASENALNSYTTMSKQDLIALLRDVIYTAEEAITEIEQQTPKTAKRGASPNNIVPFVMKEAQERHA
jgi:hypothetical protein